jgi:hypothetical protein
MNIGFHSFYQVYNKNRMFLDASSPIGDDLMYPFVYLGNYLRGEGHSISTIDMEPLGNYDAIVFFDYPTKLNSFFRKLISMPGAPPLYLVIFEPSTIRPDNWDTNNHKYFEKIFTSNLRFIDNKKYFSLQIPFKIEKDLKNFAIEKTKFCTLIASNKYSNGLGELYSERRRAIRWFEKHHPSEFDLYGVDWDRLFSPAFGRLNFLLSAIYKRASWLPRFNLYSSYGGRISQKRNTLCQYKFSICFENAVVSGWVTEKILDCFMAGVVPVYLGAPEIETLIPPETFIDMRKFSSYEDLYQYLSSMGNEEYRGYLSAIIDFLGSQKINPWTSQNFAKTLERNLVHA